MKIIIRKNLNCFVLLIVAGTIIYGQDTVTVNAGQVVGPALQRASGFLHAYTDSTTVHDSLLFPIKCRFQRSGLSQIVANYERNRKMGCSMEVILRSGGMGPDLTWERDRLPGENGNWKPWEDHVARVVGYLKSRRMTEGMSFSIWDNPDRDHGFWPSDEHYFEAWCRAQRQVKAILPSAKMVGPSSTFGPITDWWSEHPGDNTWYVRKFLDYTIAHGCIPDIVARHDYHTDGTFIESDDAELRLYYASKGMAPIPFEQSDVGARFKGGPVQFNPGHYVTLFASIERVKVLRTCKCCWDRDCFANNLNGLVTKDTRQKRSLWWTYKAYADITGDILSVMKGSSADAVAGWDRYDQKLRILVGLNDSTTVPVRVEVINLDTRAEQVRVTGCSIPNSMADPAPEPRKTLELTVPVSRGGLKFDITDMDAYGAYIIEIEGLW